jgi:hypothetical protein
VVAFTLLLASFLVSPPGDVVIVHDPASVQSDADGHILGWRLVPADQVPPGAETVPNVYLDLLDPDPTDEPLAADQWPIEVLGYSRAWEESLGEGTVIAVIDSGVDLDHPDLAQRIWTNPGETDGNGVDDDGNGLVDDVHGWDVVENDNDPRDPSVGHGTEVAGVAAAAVNGTGIAGLAPSAQILPIRACSTRCELFDVAWAITYATDLGADIINLSLGGYAQPGPLADAIDYAEQAGILVVTAAGNGGADIDGLSFVPADLPNPNLAAVAATDWDENLWADSNYGAETVDLAAPGAAIVTTTLEDLGTYRTVTGTSFAAPHVAATAALLLSIDPEMGPPQLIDHMGRYGTRLAALEGRTVHGTRIQSDRAVVAAGIRDLAASVFADDVLWLAGERITQGCNPPLDDLFCPGRPVSRGEMAAFLRRALGLETDDTSFVDTAGSVFRSDIAAIAAAGITRGCNPPDNDFYCPDRAITRGEMAAMLQRALGLVGSGPDFTDTAASVFRREISAIAAAGITRGCNPPDNDLYCPERVVTRGEMAAFLHRALG